MLVSLIPALNEQPKVQVKTRCILQPEEFYTHLFYLLDKYLRGSSVGSVAAVLPLPGVHLSGCRLLFSQGESQAAKCLSPAEAAVQVPKPFVSLITAPAGLGLGCISQPSVAPAAFLYPPSPTSLLRHFPSETSQAFPFRALLLWNNSQDFLKSLQFYLSSIISPHQMIIAD